MYITTTYIGTLNGISGIWCDSKPEGVIVTDEKQVLHPEKGYKLRKKDTLKLYNYFVLDNGYTQNDFDEVLIPDDKESQNKKDK